MQYSQSVHFHRFTDRLTDVLPLFEMLNFSVGLVEFGITSEGTGDEVDGNESGPHPMELFNSPS